MNVKLHVERVVLDGIPLDPRRASQFRAALSAELQRLLAAGGVPAAWRGGAMPEAPAAGAVTMTPGMPPAQLASAVALSIVGSRGGVGPGGGKR
jgi:hypothetical protein